ncbi:MULTISPECIES: hypothetical protein [unclassified Mesorhizobium]|nr:MULTISPECIES: hypothetical protein [unclassified Mesorhizobium]
MTYHDQHDPELHGAPPDTIPPAAQRYMAVWLTIAIVILPLAVWWLL